MRRLIPIIVLVLACVVPTAAQANHSDSPPHLSCGEIDGTFSDFPSGPQTVTLHTTVDGVPQPDHNITANGPNFSTSTGYWNPDAGSHVVQGWFTWTTSQGETGRGPLQTTTITNCPPQAPPVTIVQQTTNQQASSNQGTAPATPADARRARPAGSLVTTSRSSSAPRTARTASSCARSSRARPSSASTRCSCRGVERYGSFKKVTVRGKTRWQVTADYNDLTVPRGQLRTITTFLKLADGRKVRTVQFLRLCLDRDGNPNDTPTQDRASK